MIAFVNVLEEGRALLIERGFIVGSRESSVERVRNGKLELRADGRFLPPIDDQRLLDSIEEFA